jgi:hypothetical protein
MENWGNADDHLRAPGSIPKDVVMVHGASFPFQSLNVQLLRDGLSFLERKMHTSSRRSLPAEILAGIHVEAHRRFERVPVHLLEQPQRRKVAEALSRALQLIDESKLYFPLASEFSPTPEKQDCRSVASQCVGQKATLR